jgi:hypothetical protein
MRTALIIPFLLAFGPSLAQAQDAATGETAWRPIMPGRMSQTRSHCRPPTRFNSILHRHRVEDG